MSHDTKTVLYTLGTLLLVYIIYRWYTNKNVNTNRMAIVNPNPIQTTPAPTPSYTVVQPIIVPDNRNDDRSRRCGDLKSRAILSYTEFKNSCAGVIPMQYSQFGRYFYPNGDMPNTPEGTMCMGKIEKYNRDLRRWNDCMNGVNPPPRPMPNPPSIFPVPTSPSNDVVTQIF